MSDRVSLFNAVRPFAPDQKFTAPMVTAIDGLGDLFGLPRTAGVPVPVAGVIGFIDADLIKIVSPDMAPDMRARWAAAIAGACVKFEINTIRRVAAFIGQMALESQGFTRLNESLNYSVEGLLATFGRHRISEADARRLGRKPGAPRLPDEVQRQIANIVYGGEYGRTELGNTQPDDGWIFRGAGPLQNTGRGKATKFAAAMGMTLDEALAFMRTLEGGIMAAAWFWEENDINRLADTPGVADETRKINGGANGLAQREAFFNALVAALIKREGARA